MTVRRRDLRSREVHRAVNERIADLTARLAAGNGSDPFMMVFCECRREGCARPIEMMLSEYEAVRAGPSRWVVSSEHIDEQMDSILARRDGYALVENPERLLADALGPRKESTSSATTTS